MAPMKKVAKVVYPKPKWMKVKEIVNGQRKIVKLIYCDFCGYAH